MSAFTNWNGPDHCHDHHDHHCHDEATVPQLRTLEELLKELAELETDINNLKAALPLSEFSGAITVKAQIKDLQDQVDALKKRIVDLESKVGDASSGLVKDVVDLRTAINDKKSYEDGQTVATLVKDVGDIKITLAGITNVKDAIIDSLRENGLLSEAGSSDAFTATNTVQMAVRAIDERLTAVEVLYKRWLIMLLEPRFSVCTDFVRWGQTPYTTKFTIKGAKYTKPVMAQETILLGRISELWYKEQVVPPSDEDELVLDSGRASNAKFKGARAYVKFNNSEDSCLIIDMTYSQKGNDFNPSTASGSLSINGSAVSTFFETWDIIVGLYHGTSVSGTDNQFGNDHVYLGINFVPKDINGNQFSYDNAHPTFEVAGVNFIPYGTNQEHNAASVSLDSNLPQPTVDCIVQSRLSHAGTAISGDFYGGPDGKIEVTKLVTKEIILLNEDGDQVDFITVNGDVINIGNPAYELIFNVKSRPRVRHGDGTINQIAYVGDNAQSVYWQKDITLVVPTVAELTGTSTDPTAIPKDALKIWWDSVAETAVPTGPASATVTQKDGIYLAISTHTVPDPANPGQFIQIKQVDDFILFDDGIQKNVIRALVKNSGIVSSEKYADGTVNDDFTGKTTATVSVSKVSELDLSAIVAGSVGSINGTVLIDNKGNYCIVTGIAGTLPDNATLTLAVFATKAAAAASMYSYMLPGYVLYDKVNHKWDTANIAKIVVPVLFDKVDTIMSDATYQWAGASCTWNTPNGYKQVGDVELPWVNSYILWTAHHATTTLDYALTDPWQILSLLTIVSRPAPVPVGGILDWANILPLPNEVGWLRCDGSLVSKTTYAALYAVIQDTFGAPTSSAFFLPLQDNAIIRWSPYA